MIPVLTLSTGSGPAPAGLEGLSLPRPGAGPAFGLLLTTPAPETLPETLPEALPLPPAPAEPADIVFSLPPTAIPQAGARLAVLAEWLALPPVEPPADALPEVEVIEGPMGQIPAEALPPQAALDLRHGYRPALPMPHAPLPSSPGPVSAEPTPERDTEHDAPVTEPGLIPAMVVPLPKAPLPEAYSASPRTSLAPEQPAAPLSSGAEVIGADLLPSGKDRASGLPDRQVAAAAVVAAPPVPAAALPAPAPGPQPSPVVSPIASLQPPATVKARSPIIRPAAAEPPVATNLPESAGGADVSEAPGGPAPALPAAAPSPAILAPAGLPVPLAANIASADVAEPAPLPQPLVAAPEIAAAASAGRVALAIEGPAAALRVSLAVPEADVAPLAERRRALADALSGQGMRLEALSVRALDMPQPLDRQPAEPARNEPLRNETTRFEAARADGLADAGGGAPHERQNREAPMPAPAPAGGAGGWAAAVDGDERSPAVQTRRGERFA